MRNSIMRVIGECDFKHHRIVVKRDARLMFYIFVNGVRTQSKLNAEEVIRYLMNAMQDTGKL